ncbi:hypothetical protein P4E94_06175 [Pontiellaceae bacterium B12219]|nr:hypothetical protein [Pontiellaceae bacterium B12219]
MSALAGAPDFAGFGFPYGIVIVLFTNQRMGNLMQQRVTNFFLRSVARQIKGEGDQLVAKITATGAAGGMVEFKPPGFKPVDID